MKRRVRWASSAAALALLVGAAAVVNAATSDDPTMTVVVPLGGPPARKGEPPPISPTSATNRTAEPPEVQCDPGRRRTSIVAKINPASFDRADAPRTPTAGLERFLDGSFGRQLQDLRFVAWDGRKRVTFVGFDGAGVPRGNGVVIRGGQRGTWLPISGDACRSVRPKR